MGEKLCSHCLVVKAMDLKSIRVSLWRSASCWPQSFVLLDFPGGSEGLKKNLCAIQETWVRSLGWEDPLEEGMATHSSILD